MTSLSKLFAVLPALTAGLLTTGVTVAQAAVTTYPGALCTSDGPVDRPTNGSLISNVGGASGYQTFTCPIVRTKPEGSNSLTIGLHARLSNGSASFLCVARSVRLDGDVVSWESGTLPGYTANNQGVWSTSFQLAGPSTGYWTATLRCQIPNGSNKGGIVSYTVTE